MGRATTSLLRDRGYRVIGVDLRDADVKADLSTSEGRQAAISSIAELADGVLDGAAAFAGVSGFAGRPGGLVLGVDYFGAVDVLSGLRPCLARAGGSAALAVSSNAATTAPGIDTELVEVCLAGDEITALARANDAGGPAAYAAAKFALARWVRRASTTSEWVGAGISLNAIAPGYVETPLVSEMQSDPDGRAILDRPRSPSAGVGARRRSQR
jgi:NAD(P)-dependent dehydrogenase (short-subunit alcohol dehydrogenase family)